MITNYKDPEKNGYYLVKTEKNKWGIAYWNGFKFFDDPNQDMNLTFSLRRDFILEWHNLPLNGDCCCFDKGFDKGYKLACEEATKETQKNYNPKP